MKNPKVTLSDVADRAGMSQATASRALRGFNVHKKYRGKAEAAAAELGYVLNEAARSLRSVRTMTVGMVYHDLTSMLGMELLKATAAGLDDIGYSLFVSTAQGKDDRFDQLVHRFLQRRVDALVCVHARGEGSALGGYASSGIPVMALISKAEGYGDLPMVAPTIRNAARQCVTELLAHGHKRGAILEPARTMPPIQDFIEVAKSKKLSLKTAPVGAPDFDPIQTLRELMAQSARPTVIISFLSDALRMLEAARLLKLKVPKDLSIVAIRDRSMVVSAEASTLSTVHIDPGPMGGLLADTLKDWLTKDVPLNGDRLIDVGSWVERETTGPAP